MVSKKKPISNSKVTNNKNYSFIYENFFVKNLCEAFLFKKSNSKSFSDLSENFLTLSILFLTFFIFKYLILGSIEIIWSVISSFIFLVVFSILTTSLMKALSKKNISLVKTSSVILLICYTFIADLIIFQFILSLFNSPTTILIYQIALILAVIYGIVSLIKNLSNILGIEKNTTFISIILIICIIFSVVFSITFVMFQLTALTAY